MHLVAESIQVGHHILIQPTTSTGVTFICLSYTMRVFLLFEVIQAVVYKKRSSKRQNK